MYSFNENNVLPLCFFTCFINYTISATLASRNEVVCISKTITNHYEMSGRFIVGLESHGWVSKANVVFTLFSVALFGDH